MPLTMKGEAVELSAITLPFSIDWVELDTAVSRDISLQAICECLRKDPISFPDYQLVNGRLFYKGRIVIPATTPWIPKLLEEFHSTLTGGLLHPLPIPGDIAMDFIKGLPRSRLPADLIAYRWS
nr:Transposon Ty3-G Gag-Pol polyprotein [Ipomoea batatas]